MKRLLMSIGLLFVAATMIAQAPPPPGAPKAPPKSPAMKETATIGGKTVTIDYNSPRVHGRAGKIFSKDGLVSHDPTYPVWRAGANAATTLTLVADAKIGKLEVPKGTYTLWVDISDPEHWVLVVNKQTGQWGVKYDKAQDLGRVPMKLSTPPTIVEELKYTLKDLGEGKGTLTLAWEHVAASVPIVVE
jgi:hypothetical protein